MRKTFLIAAAAVLSIVACQKEMPVAPEGNYTVRASRESAVGTKSTVSDDGAFAWSAGDAIGLWNGTKFCELTTSTGGSATADFTGIVEGTAQSYAVFPFALNAKVESGTVKVTLPASYEWKAGETNSPMLAECGENPSFLTFKHLGGLIKVSVKNVPVEAAKFVLTADKDIAGEYSVSEDDEGNKIIKSAETAENNSVAFTFTAGTATAMAFYVPVPVGDYKFTVALQKADGAQLWNYGGASVNSVTRAKFIIMPELTLTTIPGIGEDAKTSVTIPANFSGGDFALPNTKSDVEVKVEANSLPITVVYGGDSHPGKVSIDCGSNVIKSFTIDLPDSHVELSGNEYTTLVSKTSLSTLVIANGTKVNTLTVKAGSAVVEGEVSSIKVESTVEEKAKIEVREGGKVSNVENNSKAPVVAEESNKPTVSGNGNTSVISPAAYLQSLLQAGGSILLDRDYVGDFSVPANVKVELNLNGHNITNVSSDTFTVGLGAELTISGDGTVDNVSHGKACIYNNGTVNLKGGKYTRSKEASTSTSTSGGNSYYNILNHGELIINEGVTVFQTGSFSSLIGNGYYSYTDSNPRSGYVDGTNNAAPSLTINGGSFSGGINTIKNDDGATLTINGGKFRNTTQACVQNNNVATISGGTFNPAEKHSVESRAFTGEHNKGETSISGGTFNGPLYTDGGGTFKISGGTFNDMSVEAAGTNAGNIVFSSDYELASPVILKSGALTVDLGGKTFTASSGATIEDSSKGICVTAFEVKKGTSLTVKNGKVGDAEKSIFYGVHSSGGDVTLENVEFGAKVTYAFNGSGSLSATGCTFKGWLSGWNKSGSFKSCTFTVGKAYYPAAICYGSTVFESCKFFKNGVDPDEYGDGGKCDEDGYYRCNYVVSACQPTTTLDFNSCTFVDADGKDAGKLTSENHPYLSSGWGDGKPATANIKVDGNAITITSE